MTEGVPCDKLEKFAKFFIFKSSQIIVESRLGEKVSTACKPTADLKDFYVNNKSVSGVLKIIKSMLDGDILRTKLPWCVEISLHAEECDKMVIETWCFGLLPEEFDSSAGLIYIHDSLAMVLKSLITISRILPGYKLSRRQGPDSFVLSYRFYINDPQIQCLGEDVKHIRVGQVKTPVGSLQLSVSYRTQLTTPPKPRKNESIIVESNYFSIQPGCNYRNIKHKENLDLDKPLVLPFASDRMREDIMPGLIPEHCLGKILPRIAEKTGNVDNADKMVPII